MVCGWCSDWSGRLEGEGEGGDVTDEDNLSYYNMYIPKAHTAAVRLLLWG